MHAHSVTLYFQQVRVHVHIVHVVFSTSPLKMHVHSVVLYFQQDACSGVNSACKQNNYARINVKPDGGGRPGKGKGIDLLPLPQSRVFDNNRGPWAGNFDKHCLPPFSICARFLPVPKPAP